MQRLEDGRDAGASRLSFSRHARQRGQYSSSGVIGTGRDRYEMLGDKHVLARYMCYYEHMYIYKSISTALRVSRGCPDGEADISRLIL